MIMYERPDVDEHHLNVFAIQLFSRERLICAKQPAFEVKKDYDKHLRANLHIQPPLIHHSSLNELNPCSSCGIEVIIWTSVVMTIYHRISHNGCPYILFGTGCFPLFAITV